MNRFLSSLSFTVGLFFRERTLEVNVIDMIGIEVLRMFEPDLYHQLPEKRDLLLGRRLPFWPVGRTGRDGGNASRNSSSRRPSPIGPGSGPS